MTWLDNVIATYGRPRLSTRDHPMREETESSSRRFLRNCWTWFPEEKGRANFSVVIDRFDWPSKQWITRVCTHTHRPQIECVTSTEPDDQLMCDLLRVARFLD